MTTRSQIKDFLRGHLRAAPTAAEDLLRFADWRRVAAQELEARATRIVQALDDDALKAIASGEIDLPEVVREVAAEKT